MTKLISILTFSSLQIMPILHCYPKCPVLVKTIFLVLFLRKYRNKNDLYFLNLGIPWYQKLLFFFLRKNVSTRYFVVVSEHVLLGSVSNERWCNLAHSYVSRIMSLNVFGNFLGPRTKFVIQTS